MAENGEFPDEGERSPSLVGVPRIAFVGTRQGLGLSTLVTGIVGALRKMQTGVAVMKFGSPLGQLASYRRLSGRLAFSLDPWNMERGEDLTPILVRACVGAELLIIEGDQGIIDPYPPGMGAKSPYELLSRLSCPTILLIDGQGYRDSILPMIRGFLPYSVDGVIVVNSEPGQELDRQRVVLEEADRKKEFHFLGIVPRTDKQLADFSPHLPESTRMSRTRLVNTVDLIERQVILNKIKDLAAAAPKFDVVKTILRSKPRTCKVAVADDAAMHATYQENLDLLRREGAELVPFSPVGDDHLPSGIRGIYLPDGPVEQNRQSLSQIASMLDAIRFFVRDGGVLYAEGGSLSYLFSSVTVEAGELIPMLGIIRGNAALLERFYHTDDLVECRATALSLLMRPGEQLRGFRSSRWAIRLEDPVTSTMEALSPDQVLGGQEYLDEYPPTPDGFMPRPNVFGTAFQLNWATAEGVGERFVSAVNR